jgi:hypothetical protein
MQDINIRSAVVTSHCDEKSARKDTRLTVPTNWLVQMLETVIREHSRDPAARIGSESRCSHGAHAEHIVTDFRCYKLFTLDPAFLHIHHKEKDSAECPTESSNVSVAEMSRQIRMLTVQTETRMACYRCSQKRK